MVIQFMNLKELLENLVLVVNLKKIMKRYKRVRCNMDIMRQSACLVLNPITVYNYGVLFNCTAVAQASYSMIALT